MGASPASPTGGTLQSLPSFGAKEAPVVLRIMAPLILRGLCQFSLNLISMNYVSTHAPDALPGVSLGMSLITMLGWASLSGQSQALTTLTSQVHGAKTQFAGASSDAYVNVAMFAHLMWMAFPCAMTPVLSHFLPFMGQDPAVAAGAMEFYKISLLSLPCYCVYMSYRRYLEGVMKPEPGMLGCVFGALALPVLLRGVGAAAGARDSPAWSMVILFVLIATGLKVYVGPVTNCPSLPTWAQYRVYAALAFPAMFAMMAEWWATEVMVVAAGRAGPTPLTAYAAVTALFAVLSQISYAVGSSCSVRVGYWLGAGRPKRAKQSILLHILLGCCCSVTVGVVIVTRRAAIAAYLVGTSDPERLDLTASLLVPLAQYVQISTVQSSLYGTMCGAGLPMVSFRNTVGGFWLVGIPAGLYLGFGQGRGVVSFWHGLILGVACAVALNGYFLFCQVDWANVVDPSQVAKNADVVGSPREGAPRAETSGLAGAAHRSYGTAGGEEA